MTDVLRSRIGAEDLKFGTGKFTRQMLGTNSIDHCARL